MLIKVFCVVRGGASGLLNKGGGSNRLPGLVTKQQAVEFPQVLTSHHNYTKEGPLFVRKEPTRQIAWLWPCLYGFDLHASRNCLAMALFVWV